MSKNSNWIPVMPELNEAGAFRSLSLLGKGESLKPVPLLQASTSYAAYNQHKNLSRRFSSKLKIAALGGVEGKFNSKTIIHDVAVYRKATTSQPIGGIIKGTWWGIGVRLKLIVSDIVFGFNVDIGNVGASSELGLCNVEYEISGIGLDDKELFSYLPSPGNISIASMEKIFKSFDKIRKYIAKADKSKYNLQPFMILVKDKETIDPLHLHQHIIYTYQAIKSRKRLKDAQVEALKLGLNPSIITQMYKDEFEITEINKRPSRTDKKDAEEWLTV